MSSIAKRPNGQWRARYRDEAGREHARHFAKKMDAQSWLNEVTAAIVTGNYADPKAGRITFTRYYKGWAERQVWADNTRRNTDFAAASVTFGDVPLRSLRRSHIESWVKAMSKTQAPSTVRSRYKRIRTVLRAAVADKVIPSDPSEGIALPRLRRSDASMTILTTKQVGKLLSTAATKDPQLRPIIALCAFAGLRLGEALGVQAGDVDFLRRTLKVQRQVQRRTGKGNPGTVVTLPKAGSERTVYLPDELVTILAALVRPETDPGRWFFSSSGQPLHPTSVDGRWRKVFRAAGVDGVLHDLRHFYASGLIADGCDVVTVQRALGHATATTTLNTYSHLWPTAEDRTRSAASGLAKAALADSVRTEEVK